MDNDEQKLLKAKETFRNICDLLDEKQWAHKKDEEKMSITFTMRGDDIPMDFKIIVTTPGLVKLFSWLPFKMSKEKTIETVMAINAINCRLVNGNFELDFEDNTVLFRVTQAYRDNPLGKEEFLYMVVISTKTVDDYNDKLLMLSKGTLTLEAFLLELAK